CFLLPARPPTETYTLSLHDALPICGRRGPVRICPAPVDDRLSRGVGDQGGQGDRVCRPSARALRRAVRHSQRGLYAAQAAGVLKDRKSTRLNSSHVKISYAVFCLKK